MYLPVAAFAIAQTSYRPDALAIVMMLGSAAIHVAYFAFLDRGYRTGDLSVVYPLAMLRKGGSGIGFALLTGSMIAVYTVWDRQAVAALLIPPIIYYWGSIVLRLANIALA